MENKNKGNENKIILGKLILGKIIIALWIKWAGTMEIKHNRLR